MHGRRQFQQVDFKREQAPGVGLKPDRMGYFPCNPLIYICEKGGTSMTSVISVSSAGFILPADPYAYRANS